MTTAPSSKGKRKTVAAGLASLASSGMTTAPSGKGKRKTAAAPKPKKTLTPEQRARESAKRKGRTHAAGTRDVAIAVAVVAVAAQQEVTNAYVAETTREVLYMLGLNPNQHGLINAVVAATSTGSSVFPSDGAARLAHASACNPMPGFYVYPQASRLSGECSSQVSVVPPSTSVPVPIDLNTTPVAGGSSSGGMRKCARQMPADVLSGARNLFDGQR
ncbi:DNA repair protein rhp54 [Hordeum vulgare]|nr:DNA repair protein rhp54 [Hordeum vulgare]